MKSNKKRALYAGSFDPWTFGHQFVLNAAREIFDEVHIVIAVNPSKKSFLSTQDKLKIIAHSINPEKNWWNDQQEEPYCVEQQIIISAQEGLIAHYAEKHQISHLIRGLRSTTDFESEFNLYFSNHAISSNLQTWAIMCPPRLLHCSATFVKTVVGQPKVKFVGTHFTAQALMLGWEKGIGQLFDLIQKKSNGAFQASEETAQKLQILFSYCFQSKKLFAPTKVKNIIDSLYGKKQKDIESFWDLLSKCLQGGKKTMHELKEKAGFFEKR